MSRNFIWPKKKESDDSVNFFTDKVKCGECRCWLDKSDAFPVDVNVGLVVIYYCCPHKKPYRRVLTSGMFGESRIKYFGEVEMDSMGMPIGFKKEETK